MSKITPKIIQEPIYKNSFYNNINVIGGDLNGDFGALFGINNLQTPMSADSNFGINLENFLSPSPEIAEDMVHKNGNVHHELIDDAGSISAEISDEFDNSKIGFFAAVPATAVSIEENVFIGSGMVQSDAKKIMPDSLGDSIGPEFQPSVPGLVQLNALNQKPSANGTLDVFYQNTDDKFTAKTGQIDEVKNDWLGFETKKTTLNKEEQVFVSKDTLKPKIIELENDKNHSLPKTKMSADSIDRSRLMPPEGDAKFEQNRNIVENHTLKNASESDFTINTQKVNLLDRQVPNLEIRKTLSSTVSSDVAATLLSGDANEGSARQGGSNLNTTGGNPAKTFQNKLVDMIEILDTAQENWSEVLVNRIKNGIRGNKEFIDFQLSPKNLGKVRIALMVQNDQTSIRVQTENSHAAAMIADSNPKLVQMLEASGFRLADFNSSLSGQAGSQAFNQSNNRKENEVAKANSKSEELDKSDEMVETIGVPKSSENLINIEA